MTRRTVLHVLFVILIIGFSDLNTFAQDLARWPHELNSNSSIPELMAWLDQRAFANARVGFNQHGGKTQYSYGVVISHGSPSAKATFSNGFKLANLEGCHLTLKNSAVRVIDFSGRRHNGDVKTLLENRQGETSGQVLMWLERVSYDKGKGPYHYTSDHAKAKFLGEWRTKFTYRGFFERDLFSMSFSEPEHGTMREVMTSEDITFTFDDRVTAEQFNTVFRRAIERCQEMFPR